MKKVLDEELVLYFSSNYPFVSGIKSTKTNKVTLGIGGNIGNVKKRFDKLFLSLKCDNRFDIIQTSPLLRNPPFGYLEQDDFLNGLIVVKTNLGAIEVLNAMQRYENRFGRKRSFKDAPRTLDIDMIFYNDLEINSKRLTIPHPYWMERESVTIPLEYLR